MPLMNVQIYKMNIKSLTDSRTIYKIKNKTNKNI